MSQMKSKAETIVSRDMEYPEVSDTFVGNINSYSLNISTCLFYDPAISLPIEACRYNHQKTCKRIVKAPIFISGKYWKNY